MSRNSWPQEKVVQVDPPEEWGEGWKFSTVGELNDQIVSQGIQKILLMQEAIQESGIARIAEQIVEAGNKKFVMIAGPSSLLRQDYLFPQAVLFSWRRTE